MAMFATNYNASFWLLPLLALSLLDHADAQAFVGQMCGTSQGPGLCQLITRCPSVFSGLRSGNWPEVTCASQGYIPTVCCPFGNAPAPRFSTGRLIPQVFRPIPQVFRPIPQVFRPIPEVVRPTPEVVRPIPEVVRPTPEVVRPVPEVAMPIPEVVSPTITNRAANPPSKQFCSAYEQLIFGLVNADDNSRRVINGTKAKAMEVPYIAAIGYNNGSSISWDCGGTLISNRFVLTAAHCVSSPEWGEAQWVRLGAVLLSAGNDASQVLRIVERIRHPEYKKPAKYNDIALLKLERAVIFNANITPACLDTKEKHPDGKVTVASGWGLTDFIDYESRSANLLKVFLPIVAYSQCAKFYTDTTGLARGLDDRSQICAGANDGKDTCQGDSGGPLIIKGRPLTLPRLVGITSFGSVCGSVAPGVYTRVSYYVPWIESIVWPGQLV